MDFNFVKLVVTIRLEQHADRLFLFRIKNDFTRAFRLAAGCRDMSCEGCSDIGTCCFYDTFSQSMADDPSAVKRYQKPSFPFSFHFPLSSGPLKKGMVIEFGLTLIGRATTCYLTYLAALRHLFPGDSQKEATASLMRVESLDFGGKRYLMLDADGNSYPNGMFLFTLADLRMPLTGTQDTMTITIRTPMRLMRNNAPLRQGDFALFARMLFRRVSSLLYYYGGLELQLDYKWLAGYASCIETISCDWQWVDWERKQQSGRFSGLIGSGVFRGNFQELELFLLLGQYFNLGKGASFGMGSYVIGTNGSALP